MMAGRWTPQPAAPAEDGHEAAAAAEGSRPSIIKRDGTSAGRLDREGRDGTEPSTAGQASYKSAKLSEEFPQVEKASAENYRSSSSSREGNQDDMNRNSFLDTSQNLESQGKKVFYQQQSIFWSA